MNKRQQQLFLSFFEELHQSQQLIDRLKTDLTLCQGFNPHLLFDLISQGKDQITIESMRRYLTNKMACNQRQLYQVFEKFDWSRNGYISREDFIRELSPFGRPPLTYHHRQGAINTQIQGAFIAIFLEILKRFRIIDVSRKQIGFIQPYDTFAHLDYWKKGIIGLGQLQKFYRDNDFEIRERQLYFLLHALRRRCYRDVNLQVFCQNLNPLQFGQYSKFASQQQKFNERQFLTRSRSQQQAIRRSRIDNQKFQHQIQRAQRRKQAQIERQLNLQERINLQLNDYDKKQQLNIRRALLQEQMKIRNTSSLGSSILERQQLRSMQQSRRITQIQAIRQKQRLYNQNLKRSVLNKEAELEASRRQAMLQRQLALNQQIQRQRQRQTQRVIQKQKQKVRQFQISRRQLENDMLRQRESSLRELQIQQRLRQSQRRQGQSQNDEMFQRSVKQSRIAQLQKQLDRTRAEMRERRSRLDLEDRLRGR